MHAHVRPRTHAFTHAHKVSYNHAPPRVLLRRTVRFTRDLLGRSVHAAAATRALLANLERPTTPIQVFKVMAYIVMAYIAMAYIVTAYIVMAYMVMAYIVTAYIVTAYIVTAYIVMAYIVMMTGRAQ